MDFKFVWPDGETDKEVLAVIVREILNKLRVNAYMEVRDDGYVHIQLRSE